MGYTDVADILLKYGADPNQKVHTLFLAHMQLIYGAYQNQKGFVICLLH